MSELPSYEEAAARLSPAEYRTLLAGVRLQDIILDDLHAAINRSLATAAEGLDLQVRADLRLEGADTTQPALLIDWAVTLLAKRKLSCRIKATHRLDLSVQEPVPIEFFAIYARVSAKVQAWPFLRELVHSVTGRMGVPPLSLPLLKETPGSEGAKATRSIGIKTLPKPRKERSRR